MNMYMLVVHHICRYPDHHHVNTPLVCPRLQGKVDDEKSAAAKLTADQEAKKVLAPSWGGAVAGWEEAKKR